MLVSGLYIYPIKSLGGIGVRSAKLTKRGFENDRRWMLADNDNVFLSQRTTSEMCFFDLSENADSFTINHRPSGQKIELPKQASNGEQVQIKVWEDTVTAKLSGKTFDDFFSDHLKTNCRLVEMPVTTRRLVDPDYAGADDIVSFADAYPVLTIGEASLELLNSKLDFKIDMLRFRPNIVFNGGEAHGEDQFGIISIGNTKIKNVKLCGRCVLPTIDYNTGHFQKEINSVLATYRTIDSKIMFGINCLVLNEGLVEVNQELIF